MQNKLKELMKKKQHILKDVKDVQSIGSMSQIRLVPSWQVDNNMRSEKSIEKNSVGSGIVKSTINAISLTQDKKNNSQLPANIFTSDLVKDNIGDPTTKVPLPHRKTMPPAAPLALTSYTPKHSSTAVGGGLGKISINSGNIDNVTDYEP